MTLKLSKMGKMYLFVSIQNLVVKKVACIFLYTKYIYDTILYGSIASKTLTFVNPFNFMTNLKYVAITSICFIKTTITEKIYIRKMS